MQSPNSGSLSSTNQPSSVSESPSLQEMFTGLFYPQGECQLIASNGELEKNIRQELIRIQQQEANQVENKEFFQKLMLAKETILQGNSSSFEECAPFCFATLPSSWHTNHDCYTAFSLTINYHGSATLADFFVVLDGHGPKEELGGLAARFCRDSLPEAIEKSNRSLNLEGHDYQIANGLKIAFVLLDSMFKAYLERNYPKEKRPGTTMCLAMIAGKDLFIANCGDSRAVLAVQGANDVFQLSYDFKASDAYAQRTSVKRNGQITFKHIHRVDNFLAITRAIGDEFLRNEETNIKTISCRPRIVKIPLKKEWQEKDAAYLLLGTDGLFDVLSSEQTVYAFWQLRKSSMALSQIAEAFLLTARNSGSLDDITLGVIALRQYAPL